MAARARKGRAELYLLELGGLEGEVLKRLALVVVALALLLLYINELHKEK